MSIRSFYQKNNGIHSRVGTGFVVDRGFIATRKNVVDKADSIWITLEDGRSSAGVPWYWNSETNLVFLKTDLKELIPLETGSSKGLMVNASLTILGNSLGIFPSVTLGTFAGKRPDGMLEIHCLVPPGNSGGPVLDSNGKLIGMVLGRVHKEQFVEMPEAIAGIALPVEAVQAAFQQGVKNNKEGTGWIGISVVDLDESRSAGKGVRVIRLIPGGPADLAGIGIGDTLVQAKGCPIQNARQLAKVVQKSEPNSRIVLSLRKGKILIPKQVIIGIYP